MDFNQILETYRSNLDTQSALVFFVLLATLALAVTYWRDSTREGFSSNRILDSLFVMMIGGLIGGKLLFRDLSIDYFRYQIATAPVILEGILVGGGLAMYIMVRRNKWDGWKIGDMIAPALALFQAIIYFGFWFINPALDSLAIFLAFTALYIFIRSLKKSRNFGSSLMYFHLRRLNKPTFTGALFAVYLTGSGLIAMLFLATHVNTSSWFWWFQIVFYLTILGASLILFRRRLRVQGITLKPMKSKLSNNFITKMKNRLTRRLYTLEEQKEHLKEKDPFTVEYESEGSRNEDEIGDETADLQEHRNIEATLNDVDSEIDDIKESLDDMKKGKYGISKKSGQPISKDRLEAYPTAKTNVEDEDK